MKLGRIYFDHTTEGYRKVKDSGLDFVEICCNFDHDNKAITDAKETIKKAITDTGIDVSCLGRWNHELLKDGKIDYEKLVSNM